MHSKSKSEGAILKFLHGLNSCAFHACSHRIKQLPWCLVLLHGERIPWAYLYQTKTNKKSGNFYTDNESGIGRWKIFKFSHQWRKQWKKANRRICPLVLNVFLDLLFQTIPDLKQNKQSKPITNIVPTSYQCDTL